MSGFSLSSKKNVNPRKSSKIQRVSFLFFFAQINRVLGRFRPSEST